ncbi:hypothetical protein BST97_12395 [Nonlabens spongiae]|uniref:Tryptophan-rich sensory protein n=1 Tax=Nonlabens spongiae TaxID=331648 RepID=A0A1W6MMA7_9FLAO|nr:hypothetical protein [Nonlabens spongiae]ARN78728.1 hypothetical protein BST97_12395 [Nonlabens spongiae]
MKRKLFSIQNLLSVIILIAWNGYANTGNFNGKTVGDLSAEYNNLFTPASYAFSIWGLIFLMLLVFGIYGVYSAFAKASTAVPNKTDSDYRTDFVTTTAPWFLMANIFCSLWVGLWLEEMIGLSVVCMLGILICLIACIIKLDMEIWDAPFPIIAFVWWPVCLYSGWISVAIIANVSAWLNHVLDLSQSVEIGVTVIMILIASIINLAMVLFYNMREFTMVGVWALVAIFIRHHGTLDSIAYVALTKAIMLTLAVTWHGYKNFKTNPLLKFQQWRMDK